MVLSCKQSKKSAAKKKLQSDPLTEYDSNLKIMNQTLEAKDALIKNK